MLKTTSKEKTLQAASEKHHITHRETASRKTATFSSETVEAKE